jgi:hypothetical protein
VVDGDGTGAVALAGVQPADPWDRFDSWAAWLLLALAVVDGVAALLTVGELSGNGSAPWLAALVGGSLAVAAVASWLGWRGLQAPRPWGRTLAVALLVIVAFFGAISAIADLAAGRITIPLAAIAALVVVNQKPGRLPLLDGRDRRIVRVVVGSFVVATLAPYLGSWASTSAASPFVAQEDDLQLSITADCPGGATAFPDEIRLTARWAWSETDVLSTGTDGITITWDAPMSDPVRYEVVPSTDPFVWLGGGDPSARLLAPVLDAVGGAQWGIDVAGGGQRPGEVSVVLRPVADDPSARPPDGSLLAQARYAHGDRWVAIAEASCEW